MKKVIVKYNILIKKIIVVLLLIANLSFLLPNFSFSADEEDDDEKYPALMPMAADSIISKYINTDLYGISGSASGGIITSYEEEGDGWLSVTEVKYPNGTTRKFRNYQQGISSFCSYWNKPYWGGNMQNSGCGPTAAAIVLSGYGYDANPGVVVDAMNVKDSSSFEHLRQALKDIGNIDGEDHYGNGTSGDIAIIRENLRNGRPVIVNAPNHYIVLLGEDESGKLIVSDPGSKFYVSKGYENIGPSVPGAPDNLEDFVNKGMITCGYILITSDGNANTNASETTRRESTSNNSKSEITNKTKSNSENKNTKTTENGEAKIEECNPDNGGYEKIFTSGTTGRQFKEYRQNLDGWNSRYNISNVGCSWTSECGLVSCMIVGSGYSEEANFENATNILVNELGGSTVHSVFLNRWIPGQSASYRGYYNEGEMIENLKNGCVGILCLGTTSSFGQHYVTVLDYDSSNGKVYVSNPWMNGFPVGWSNPSELTGQMGVLSVRDMIFFSNDGSIVNYSGGGSSKKHKSNVKMSSNIIPRDENNPSKGYKINIDLDKEIEDMLTNLNKLEYDMSNYLSSKNDNEYLKNMIKACIVTQYPDLRSAKEISDPHSEKDPDEVQGCVKIKRYPDGKTEAFASGSFNNPIDSEENGGGMYLEYKPLEDLRKMIDESDKSAFNYFSMDSSNNIVVAGWETMNVSVDIQQTNIGEAGECPTDVYGEVDYTPKAEEYVKLTSKSINYLDQISNYTLPFSLFWSLLVYGHDQEFINDFANLVIRTDIVLGCFDAVTTTTTTYTDTWSKTGYAITDNYVNVDDAERGNDSGLVGSATDNVSYDFEIIETDILTTDKPNLKVKYANIWTAVYNKDYIIETKDSEEKGDKVEFEDKVIENNFYQKTYDEDGRERYTNDRKIKDNQLLEKVDESIKENLANNLSVLEQRAEEKNSQYSYRYTNLTNFLRDKSIIAYENTDIYRFLMLKEVQSNIINCIINIYNDSYIENIFNIENNNIMIENAKKINNNYGSLISGACSITKRLVNEFVREQGGTESELYKLLTRDGNDTRKCYTISNMQSSQIEEILKDTNRTEEYEKNTEQEEVKEVPTNDNIRWKNDKYADEESFVKLLAHSNSAQGNLRVVSAWFFESLEETAAIADYEDLLKYLFQCAFGFESKLKPEEIDKLLKDLFTPGKKRKVSGTSTLESIDAEGIYNYLIGQGFTNAGAAGLMGNIMRESSLRPIAVQSVEFNEAAEMEYIRKVDSGEMSKEQFIYDEIGFGLVQFTYYTLKADLYDLAREKGKSIGDAEIQLELVIRHFQEDYKHVYDTVTTSDDLLTCTNVILREYENPDDDGGELSRRYAFAQEFYK